MGDEKAQRLDDALSSLVDILIPDRPDEDETTADERHDDALELARSIIDKCVTHERALRIRLTLPCSQGSPTVASDVNHAAELIRKKCKFFPSNAPLRDQQADPLKYAAATTLRTKKSTFLTSTLDFSHSRCCRRNGRYYIFYINWQIQIPKVEALLWTIRVPKVGIRDCVGIVMVRISRYTRMRLRRLGFQGCHHSCVRPG